MSWKEIIKEDDFSRYLPRDAGYVSEEEYLQRAEYLFDKKNIGRIFRNKVTGMNYIFERLMGNGDIVLRSAPDEEIGQSEKEKLKMSLDLLNEFGSNHPDMKKLISMTEHLIEQASDKKPKTQGETHILPPDLGLNYDLLPEQ
jgi:hypothetical protein